MAAIVLSKKVSATCYYYFALKAICYPNQYVKKIRKFQIDKSFISLNVSILFPKQSLYAHFHSAQLVFGPIQFQKFQEQG